MKRSKLVLFFILVCKSGIGQSLYDSAVRTYYRAQLSTAVELFSTCISNKEHLALSHMYRGIARAFLGKADEGLEDLAIAIKMDSANDKIYYYYGKAYALKEQYSLALRYITKSIEMKPGVADKYDAMSYVEDALGNYGLAIKYEDQAIALDSSNAVYYQNRGFAKIKSHYYEDAIIDLTRSLSIEKGWKALFDRGLAYYELHMDEKAIEDLNASLAINPGNNEAYYDRALSYLELNKKNEACSDFKKSAEMGLKEASQMLQQYCK